MTGALEFGPPVPATPVRLLETPSTWRYMADDGQVLDVTGYREQSAREHALAHFESHTARPKPTKTSAIWVKIEGVATLARGALEGIEPAEDR